MVYDTLVLVTSAATDDMSTQTTGTKTEFGSYFRERKLDFQWTEKGVDASLSSAAVAGKTRRCERIGRTRAARHVQ